jgi:hypothetical protein
MNAARFARNLVEDGVEPKLAQSLAEHLADELDRTVATKEHVEMVVTREVQGLRVEMHHEFERQKFPKTSEARQVSRPAACTSNHWAAVEGTAMRHFDLVERCVLSKMDANFHRNMIWVGLLYLGMLGNIIKDFLR